MGPERDGPILGCQFYSTDTGAEPVREWLRGLASEVRVQIGSDIGRVQWRWPVGRPLVGSLGDGLYEVRTTHDGNAYRVLFSIMGSDMVLLHGFQKKTRRTRPADIELARRRMR